MKIGRNKIQSAKLDNVQANEKDIQASKQTEKQIDDISNICYKPLNFGRSWAEHKSWGAIVNPQTKDVTFKIFTFPDTKRVSVTVIKPDNKTKTYELKNSGGGIFMTEGKIPSYEVKHGDKYYYTIYKANGDTVNVKDPYSFKQEELLGKSVVYDHSLYKWNDSKWFGNSNERISRKANASNKLTPVKAARIYEFNTATITKNGTFKSAESILKNIKDMGFNCIELMPAENTYSFNWGYDGVDKMAPSTYLGGPDQLKSLIDKAHQLGLNVIMDMVPNHLGPDGASLQETGPYIKGPNAFGSAFNYEGADSRYVRDYIINSAINWIENYHCDGLRLDMTSYMESDHTMKQLAAEINFHKPEAFIIAEDGRGNDPRVINGLQPAETGEGAYGETMHVYAIEALSDNLGALDRLGYDSEWDFKYYHTLSEMLYENVDLNKLEEASYDSQNRVKYLSSHDEQGNFEGTAFIAKHMVPMLHLNENVVLFEEDYKRARDWSRLKSKPYEETCQTVIFQKAQLVSEKLAIMYQTGALDKYNTKGIKSEEEKQRIEESFKNEILKPLGIRENCEINYDEISRMFKKSFNKHKFGMAVTYSTPGPKMVFQGDENGDLTPFRFFRQFQSIKDEPYLYIEKGYKEGKSAFDESKMGTIKYSSKAISKMNKLKALMKDLNKINAENPALTTGNYVKENTIKHPYSQVIGFHIKDNNSNNEIFTVNNFSDYDYPREDAQAYYINFPPGKWVEILNTDDRKYGGKGNTTQYEINSNGSDNRPIHISRQSTAIFKRIA